MDINIAPLASPAVSSLPVEIVERKGRGHPDSICDALAEGLSVALCRYYLEHFGAILHHNVDKALLVGGSARAGFGGGEVLQPIDLFLAGRATSEFRGKKVPLEEIAIEGTRRWIRENLRYLDPERHVRIHCLFRPGSADLAALYGRVPQAGAPAANDTSCGVGYAPLDALEQVVLSVERHLNSAKVKAACPAIGEDIKVMGLRRGQRIDLTVACAMVARHVANMASYRACTQQVAEFSLDAARRVTGASVKVIVNGADGVTPDSLYLTETGTSAEAGDDGEVGRGNRVNGLITFYRPMSLEAAAGKNPVSHVGKLYNLAANRIARTLVEARAGVEEVYCHLVSGIGRPINVPQVVDLKLRLAEGISLGNVQPHATAIVHDELGKLPELWGELIAGSLPVF